MTTASRFSSAENLSRVDRFARQLPNSETRVVISLSDVTYEFDQNGKCVRCRSLCRTSAQEVGRRYNVRVANGAYLAALKMLARRELSEAQVRGRLARRQFEEGDIDAAVAQLRREGALDDRRTAIACARTEAHVKRHGRLRAVRAVEALGIARSLARTAVAEAFADLDEDALLVQAIERRVRREAGMPTPAAVRRLHRYLLAQGFEAARVSAAIRSRFKTVMYDD